jgi:hypothetical protein
MEGRITTPPTMSGGGARQGKAEGIPYFQACLASWLIFQVFWQTTLDVFKQCARKVQNEETSWQSMIAPPTAILSPGLPPITIVPPRVASARASHTAGAAAEFCTATRLTVSHVM